MWASDNRDNDLQARKDLMVPAPTQPKCQVPHAKGFSLHVELCHRFICQSFVGCLRPRTKWGSFSPQGSATHTYLDVGSFFPCSKSVGNAGA
jgi:hypothetical protein